MIDSKLYLIGMEHMRRFGEPRTIDAGNFIDTNNSNYCVTGAQRSLGNMQCDESTDKNGFKLLENKIETKITTLINC